jgi:iron complex outermembrane receptor protein
MRATGFSVKIMCACGCAAAGLIAATASAQTASVPSSGDGQTNGITDIVVTAQKREQNQQDVPISITAVTSKLLEANRITSVVDLGAVVPNLAVRSSGGGSQLPAFSMRGITSYGVVPGADKELSIYIDGVYVASTVGSAIDLPDLDRIEVLRGPQGTLFGRNATVGAISVITRNPPDQFGFNQDFSVGNYNQFRSKTRIDFGSLGDFSATASFVHDERRGDIRNLGAGTTFHYPETAGIPTTQISPEYLGDKDENIVFAAIKYEPNTDFRILEKFDWTGNHYTPNGVAAVGVYPAALGEAGGAFLSGILATQTTPPVFDTSGQRPSTVNNSFSLPAYARNWGDSVTIDYRATDNLSFKNIVAYRESYVRASNQLDGLGGLTITPATAAAFGYPTSYIGSPFLVLGIQQVTTSSQWSEEFQINYNSSFLTVTAGGLYFHLKTQSGGAPGLPNDVALTVLPGGLVGGEQSTAYNKGTSIAGYVQAEGHITSKLDLVGGVRVTNDKKSGSLLAGPITTDFTYSKTEPSFSAGVNYKPSEDVLLYAKYSTAFVSGGAAGPIVFKPEKAKSWEIGAKSEWFDRRLRANIALFDVRYTDLQQAESGVNFGYPNIGLAIGDQGNEHAKGVEIETTAVPIRGVTLGIAGGYTDVKFTSITPFFSTSGAQLGVPLTLSNYLPTLTPKWTTNLSAEYDTPEVYMGGRLTFRVDASWRSKELTDSYTVFYALPQYDSIKYSPATWLVNTRIAFDKFKLPVGTGTIAFWTKNLTNAKEVVFPDIVGGFAAGTEYQTARTIGFDISFNY